MDAPPRPNAFPACLAAWKWAPLIVLLTLQVHPAPFITLAGAPLILPIAVHLAQRYGRTGLVVIALAGLPLLGRTSFGSVGSEAWVGLYAAALIMAWWFQTDRLSAGSLPRLGLSPLVCLGLLALPLSLGLGSSDIPGLFQARWIVTGFPLFFLLAFILGLSRAPARPVLIALSAATALGILLELLPLPRDAAELIRADRAELPLLGLVELGSLFLSYRLDTPAELLTGLGFFCLGSFSAGQAARGSLSLPKPMLRAWLLLTAVLLALGGGVNASLLPWDIQLLQLLGCYYALLLAGLLAGLFFRFGGMLAVMLLVCLFWWIDGVLRAGLDVLRPHFDYELDQLLVVLGFGLLGIRLRDALAGTSSRLWSATWLRSLFVYLLILLSAIPLGSPYGFLLLTSAFLAGPALALLLGRLRDRLAGTEIVLPGAWLSLVCLGMTAYLLTSFSLGAWQGLEQSFRQGMDLIGQLFQARQALDEQELLLAVLSLEASLGVVWLIGSTLKQMLQSIRQLADDLRAVLRRWGSGAPLSLGFRSRAREAEGPAQGKVRSRAIVALTWINRAVLATLIAVPLAFIGWNLWLDHQEDLAREERLSRLQRRLPAPPVQSRQGSVAAQEDLLVKLAAAAESVLSGYPGLTLERHGHRTTIRTGWFSAPDAPQVRRRLRLTIRPDIFARELPRSRALPLLISVSVSSQHKGRFGLWVEYDRDPDRETEERLAERIEDAVVSRAMASDKGG